jgi:hypothetical protein
VEEAEKVNDVLFHHGCFIFMVEICMLQEGIPVLIPGLETFSSICILNDAS